MLVTGRWRKTRIREGQRPNSGVRMTGGHSLFDIPFLGTIFSWLIVSGRSFISGSFYLPACLSASVNFIPDC